LRMEARTKCRNWPSAAVRVVTAAIFKLAELEVIPEFSAAAQHSSSLLVDTAEAALGSFSGRL
jgi:hypothetical protein